MLHAPCHHENGFKLVQRIAKGLHTHARTHTLCRVLRQLLLCICCSAEGLESYKLSEKPHKHPGEEDEETLKVCHPYARSGFRMVAALCIAVA